MSVCVSVCVGVSPLHTVTCVSVSVCVCVFEGESLTWEFSHSFFGSAYWGFHFDLTLTHIAGELTFFSLFLLLFLLLLHLLLLLLLVHLLSALWLTYFTFATQGKTFWDFGIK